MGLTRYNRLGVIKHNLAKSGLVIEIMILFCTSGSLIFLATRITKRYLLRAIVYVTPLASLSKKKTQLFINPPQKVCMISALFFLCLGFAPETKFFFFSFLSLLFTLAHVLFFFLFSVNLNIIVYAYFAVCTIW